MTDYAMPRMTGAELIKLLRARHHQLPVVLATGYADLTEADLGVHVVRLGKPFTQANLERALRAAMDAAAAGSAEGKSTALVEPEEAGL